MIKTIRSEQTETTDQKFERIEKTIAEIKSDIREFLDKNPELYEQLKEENKNN